MLTHFPLANTILNCPPYGTIDRRYMSYRRGFCWFGGGWVGVGLVDFVGVGLGGGVG